MKNRPNVSLSLRKLFTAMLAVGPVAILPSPVWAALPTSASFAIQNGSASVSTLGSVATISTSDRAVLQWGAGNFTIAAGEAYNFQMPAGGAVLNRVGTSVAVDTATIAGQIDSNGRVFILAPGGTINVQNEQGMEVFYDYAITPAIRLIPSYQHIWNPLSAVAAGHTDADLWMMRGTVVF